MCFRYTFLESLLAEVEQLGLREVTPDAIRAEVPDGDDLLNVIRGVGHMVILLKLPLITGSPCARL